ncbi:MAG: DUF115 domain-containing protein [Deltaproteobacteria bacterium]|nr:DUF115 domain-containing protein [Deltaproteobacteria bacterium]
MPLDAGTKGPERHLERLAARFPRVAGAVRAATPISPADTPLGPAFRAADASGRAVTLASPADPDKEARDAIWPDVPEKFDGPVILFGVGLGHRVPAILDRLSPAGRIAAIVVRPAAFAAGFYRGVLGAALDDPRVSFDLGDEKGLRGLAPFLNDPHGVVLLNEPVLRVADPSAAPAVRLADMVRTYGGASQRTIRAIRANYEANLETLCADEPVALLEGRLHGAPCVVAGAGPSLDGVLADLARRRDSFFLIAADAAISPLNAAGVTPDLAVSVDPFEPNAAQCRDLPERPPLVWMPSVHPDVVRAWTGRRFAALPTLDPVAEALDRHLGVGRLLSGGIVGTAATALAHFMGAGTYILAGMDLAFSGGKTHARAAFHRADAGSPYDVRVPAVGGGTVLTNAAFRRAISWFEHFAAHEPGRCFDLGNTGARKTGFEPAVLDGLASDPVDRSLPPPARRDASVERARAVLTEAAARFV